MIGLLSLVSSCRQLSLRNRASCRQLSLARVNMKCIFSLFLFGDTFLRPRARKRHLATRQFMGSLA